MNLLVIDRDYTYFKLIRSAVQSALDGLHVWYVPRFEGALENFTVQINEALERGDNVEPTIDALVVSWEGLGSDAFSALKTLMSRVHEHNDHGSCVVLLSGFDQTAVSPKGLLATEAADLLFKPFDELLFLQKLRVLVPGIRSQERGNFLYTSKTPFAIELAGEYSVAGLSEGGVQLRSRAPLPAHRKMKMYSSLFGDAGRVGLYGLPISSQATADGSRISEVSFFGLAANQLRALREVLMPYRRDLAVSDRERVRRPARQIHLTENGVTRKRKILLIDLDNEMSDILKQLIHRNFEGCELETFGSYEEAMVALGVSDALTGIIAKDLPTEWAGRPAFSSGGAATLLYSAQTLTPVGSRGFPGNRGTFAGLSLEDLLSRKDVLNKVIHPGDRGRFKDFLAFSASGQNASILVRLVNKSGQAHLTMATGHLERGTDGLQIVVDFHDQTSLALQENRALDLVALPEWNTSDIIAAIIDLSFVERDPDALLNGFANALAHTTGRDQTPIFLTAKEASIDELLSRAVVPANDLFFKPLDRGYFIRKIRQAIDQTIGSDGPPETEPFVPFDSWIDIAKPITADGIGEYGIDFTHTSAVPQGAWGYFYHPELVDDDGRGILGRCIRTETVKVGPRKEVYRMQFLFLAIRDQQLTKLRLFIKKFSIADAKKRTSQ